MRKRSETSPERDRSGLVPRGEQQLFNTFCVDKPDQQPLRVLVVCAHSDDEVIGAGAQLSKLSRRCELCVVHVTDGAPRDASDATRLGFQSRQHYARARALERVRALALAGIGASAIIDVGVVDQEATSALPLLVRRVTSIIATFRPEIVLTQPYEGGHPDHDATAFAVHVAVNRLDHADGPKPVLVEMTSYHARGANMVTGEFLPAADRDVRTIVLDRDSQILKRQMFDCYHTQQRVLSAFNVECERFRIAPRYDFTGPPHPGQLFYERFPWGMTGVQWHAIAMRALNSLSEQSALSVC